MTAPIRGPTPLAMVTADGVRLDADLWRPDDDRDYPALLMRQPYGRAIASTVVYAHPAWYAARGYCVIVQDVRGTGTSDGRFRLFEAEERDGAEALAWAARQPGTTGAVGMYGFSYQGVTQLLALAGAIKAGTRPERLALAPAMVGWTIRDDWAHEGGAFCFASNVGWAAQMAALQARRACDANAFAALSEAAAGLLVGRERPARPEILARHAALTQYDDWLEPTNGYWDRISPEAALRGLPIDVPMLHVGGWYDAMLAGTLACHQAMAARATAEARQHLMIGPWAHLPWGRRVGAVDFGPEAVSPVDRVQLAWFDHWLKGDDQGLAADVPVYLFDLGRRDWRGFPAWPEPEPVAAWLASDGLAAASTEAGRLEAEAPEAPEADRFVHDPWRPVPALGGHNAAPGGMQDRAAIDSRADVPTYTTPPLEADLDLAGPVAVELWVEADAPSFDISAVLSEVDADGAAWNLTQAHRRIEPGEALPIRIAMRAICITVPAGSALRLSLAGACWPAHLVNPGTGTREAETRAIEARPITLAIHSGGDRPSRLLLPVRSAE